MMMNGKHSEIGFSYFRIPTLKQDFLYLIQKDDIKDKKTLLSIYKNQNTNYYVSSDFSEEFYILLAKCGFISTSIFIENEFYLLPEIQFEYAVLDFENLYISKKIRKLLNQNNFNFYINNDINNNNLIELIKNRLNIEIKLIPTKTWEESLALSKNKECDILSFLNETPKRKEWLDFTNTLFTDENVIIGRSENPLIKDLSKIKASIAIPKGTAMYEKIQSDFPNLVIIPVNSEEEAFKYVEQKKANLTIRSLIVAAFTIKKNGFFILIILNKPEDYGNILNNQEFKDFIK